MKSIRTLYLVFDRKLDHYQVGVIKTKFSELSGGHQLFTKRDEENKEDYDYPLVQYRIHEEGNAAIFAINEGADLVEKLIAQKKVREHFWEKDRPLKIILERDKQFNLKLLKGNQRSFYSLFRWVPLNSDDLANDDNSREGRPVSKKEKPVTHWNELFMDEKVKRLEQKLANQIIGFASKVGWQISKTKALDVRLYNIRHINHDARIHGLNHQLSFDLTYATNAVLPEYLGLGRGKSMGYGWQITADRLPKQLMNEVL